VRVVLSGRGREVRRVIFALVLAFLFPRASAAATITPATCSYSDVNTAVNTTAAAGDTVSIPAGSCTWATQLAIVNKAITITGPSCTLSKTGVSSACSLVITGNVGTAPIINVTTCSATNFVTLANFTIQVQSSGSGSGMINISCSAASGVPAVALRVHHVQFNGDSTDGTTDNSSSARWFDAGAVFGVLDHCQFLAQTTKGMGNAVADKDNPPSSTTYLYHHPFSLGDPNALYIEDSFFYSITTGQGNGAVDNYISRYVIRFSTIYNNNIGNHGLDSQSRGVPTFEAYGNTFIADTNGSGGSESMFGPRSGTGIVWGNIVQNMTGTNHTYSDFFTPVYYRAVRISEMVNGNGGWPDAPAVVYPSGSWASYSGSTSSFSTSEYVGLGSLKNIDGNQFGLDNMDSSLSRTITSVTTTSGSGAISAAGASFSSGCTASTDLCKFVVMSQFKAGRESSCSISSTTLTCNSESFDDGDVGRHLITANRNTFNGQNWVRIQSVSSAHVATLFNAVAGSACSPCQVLLSEPFLVSVSSGTAATMNVHATASTSSGTLVIGFTNQGYPLLDQPGRGYFAAANVGAWPTASSYTDANYEGLMPVYLVGNLWQTVNASLVVQSSANPPASAVNFVSTAGYMKANRDWYDPAPNAGSAGIQTSASSPFDGTVGTGIGTIANRPTTCTAGVGYWAVDEGNWNQGGFTYTYPNGGSTYTQGNLYQCVAANTWSLYYTPYCYPHTLASGGTCPAATTSSNGAGLRRIIRRDPNIRIMEKQ
jgi:hypothetical protein